MTKTILGVLSLLVIMSCSIPVKENTVQPNIMETNKKNLGNLLALYPKPMTVVGAEVEGKVNWLVVGHTGVIGHDRILISMSKSHYTNQGIKDSKRLSVNLVSREILPKADYVGSVSGATVDKSEVFAYHIGENGTPVIDASPLTMECEVVDIYETEGFDNFICAIVNTYAAPEVLDNNGKLDYTKLKPVLFEFPTYSYLATGEIIGKCLWQTSLYILSSVTESVGLAGNRFVRCRMTWANSLCNRSPTPAPLSVTGMDRICSVVVMNCTADSAISSRHK